MKQYAKRFLGILLTLALALSPVSVQKASAENPTHTENVSVNYYYYANEQDAIDGKPTLVKGQMCSLIESVDGSNVEKEWHGTEGGSWYAVVPEAETAEDISFSVGSDMETRRTITLEGRYTVSDGIVNLVLCDGAALFVTDGIEIKSGATLNIYAGTNEGTNISGTCIFAAGYIIRKITARANTIFENTFENYAGIDVSGTLNIHGGEIYGAGGENAAGIGGNNEKNGGSVYIFNGYVKATGGANGAGIGGGNKGNGADMKIYGGTVTATGGANGAGIGGGNSGSGIISTLTIKGGTVTATGGENGAGIGGGNGGAGVTAGGTLSIIGGKITATGGKNGAGIGGGRDNLGVAGTLTISGGEITATGGENAAGIGGGAKESNTGIGIASGGILSITNGSVIAKGGKNGAGIGGGYHSSGIDSRGALTVSGGSVTAFGGAEAAGIGGGYGGAGLKSDGIFTISDGNIVAFGGEKGAGIGGGNNGNGGDSDAKLTITGGDITAFGGTDGGAGIGGGYNGDGLEVEISEVSATTTVTASGKGGGAGIGGGNGENDRGGNGAKVTISGGSVVAKGGELAAGIGGGDGGNGVDVTISGDSTCVAAIGGKDRNGIGSGKSVDSSRVKINGTYYYYKSSPNQYTAPDSSTVFNSDYLNTDDFNRYMIFEPSKHTDSDPETGETITFFPWTETTILPENGYYYLVGNVILDDIHTINDSKTLNLCLNGKTVFGPATSHESGTTFFVDNNGILNLFDNEENSGKITHVQTINGRGVNVYGGTFNMYGGSITGNILDTEGAGVEINDDGTFNMYSGIITGNQTYEKSGAGVYVSAETTFNMYGGSIIGNIINGDSGKNSLAGAGVFIEGNIHGSKTGTFNVSGNVKISDNYIQYEKEGNVRSNVWLSKDAVFDINGELTNSDKIGFSMENPGVFTAGWNSYMTGKNPENYFSSDVEGWLCSTNGNEARIVQPAIRYVEYTADNNGKLTEEIKTTVNYIVVSRFNTTNSDARKWYSGDYVLVQDVDSDSDESKIQISGSDTVVNLILCDGAKLHEKKGIEVTNGATLNIYAGSSTATEETSANDIIENAGKLYATQPNTPAKPTSSQGGSGIIVDCGGKNLDINATSTENAGKLNIHGGIIEAQGYVGQAGIGGRAGAIGGNVTIYNGTVNAVGGNSNSTNATGPGAGIGGGGSIRTFENQDASTAVTAYGNGGTVIIYGGTVTATGGRGNEALGPGGAGIGGGGGNYGAGNNIVLSNCDGLQGSRGGKVYIYGGTVTATGINGGAGIGGGAGGRGGVVSNGINIKPGNGANGGDGGEVYIYGGSVSATSCDTGGDKNRQNAEFLMKGTNSPERRGNYGFVNAEDSKRVGIGGGAGGIRNIKNDGVDGSDGSNGKLVIGKNVESMVKGEENGSEWTILTNTDIAEEKTFDNYDPERANHYFKAHGHIWSFSADDATITAACANEDYWYDAEPPITWHDTNAGDIIKWIKDLKENGNPQKWHTEPITVTLTAEGGVYNGQQYGATLNEQEGASFNLSTGLSVSEAEILYVGRGNTVYAESATAPTEAGTYTASITVEGKTTTVDYEIEKDKVSVTAEVGNRTLEYTGEIQDLITPGEVTGGDFYYAIGNENEATGTYTTNVPSATNAGKYYIWYKVVADDNHQDTDAKYVLSTIGKVATTVTVPEYKTMSYDSSVQNLVSEGAASGGTMYYALGENDETEPSFDGTSESADKKWNTSVPTAANAGTYYVWYMVKGDNNHLDTEAKCLISTISKVAPTVTVPTSKTLTYDSSVQELISKGAANGGTMYYALGENDETEPSFDGTSESADKKWSTSIPTATNAGTYYVWYMVKGDGNHTDTSAVCVVSYIEVAEIKNVTVTLKENSFEETGEEQGVVIESVTSGNTVFNENDYVISGTTAAKDIGEYTITATLTGNYSGSGSATWNILEKKKDETEKETKTGTGSEPGPAIVNPDEKQNGGTGSKNNSGYNGGNNSGNNSTVENNTGGDVSTGENGSTGNTSNSGNPTGSTKSDEKEVVTSKTYSKKNGDGTTTDVTEKTFTDGSLYMKEETKGNDGNVTITEKTVESDKTTVSKEVVITKESTTTKEETVKPDGTAITKEEVKTKEETKTFEKTVQSNGTTITKNTVENSEGKISEKKTEKANGTVIEKKEKYSNDGSSVKTQTTTYASGKIKKSETVRDSDGSKKVSSETRNLDGTGSSKTVETDAEGNITKTEKEKHTITKNGNLKTVTTVKKADGSSETVTQKEYKSGKTVISSKSVSKNGIETKVEVSISSKGNATVKSLKTGSTKATIPSTVIVNGKKFKVTTITAHALSGNLKLKKVTVGKNITKIEEGAFEGDKKLEKITLTDSIKEIGANAFSGISKKAVITIKASSEDEYNRVMNLVIDSGVADTVSFVFKATSKTGNVNQS